MSSNPSFGPEWLDNAEIKKDVNKVTEDAVKRIQEQGKKAKQAQQDIKQDKKTNAWLWQFLTFITKSIKNEKLINLLYNTFFKVKHPQNNITYLRKNINTKVIVGIFVPFYTQKAQEYKVTPLYENILTSDSTENIPNFMQYLKKLAKTYHDNIPLDKEVFTKFITEIILLYISVHTDKPINERRQMIALEVAKHLYGQ